MSKEEGQLIRTKYNIPDLVPPPPPYFMSVGRNFKSRPKSYEAFDDLKMNQWRKLLLLTLTNSMNFLCKF